MTDEATVRPAALETTDNRTHQAIRKHSPLTLELIGEVPVTPVAELPAVLARAKVAQEEWASWPMQRRVQALRGLQLRLIDRLDELATLVSEETGKPRIEAVDTDLITAITAGDHALAAMKRLFKPQRIDLGKQSVMMRYMGRRSYVQNRPLGVIGIISPWNYPIGLPYSQIIMAVAAGNAVVLKPSSETPLTGLEIGKLFEHQDLPKHLVQVIVGRGGELGSAFAASGVDRLIFTGSTEVGRTIASLAAQRLTPITLELGGKDPFVVFDDADLERAVDAALWGSFVNAGQTCACVKRIYLQDGIYEMFLSKMVAKTKALKLGDGREDPEVSIGPLIHERSVRDIEEIVQTAIDDGGKVLAGGKRPAGLKGHFFEPTIIADVPQSSAAVQEEAFGPLVCVLRFRTEDEAVQLANDNAYALAGSVWTRDLEKGKRVAEQLSGGSVLVNNTTYTYGLMTTPWGGRGASGYGRTHGELGFAELVYPHHIHVDSGRARHDIWWHPYTKEKLDASLGLVDLLYRKSYSRKVSAALRARKIMKGK